jgi:hypothetical protein
MAMAYLVGRNFDLSCYSSVFGLLMGLFGISYGLAPVLASRLFDMMGSYDQLFRIMAVMLVVAIVIIGSVKQGRPSIA